MPLILLILVLKFIVSVIIAVIAAALLFKGCRMANGTDYKTLSDKEVVKYLAKCHGGKYAIVEKTGGRNTIYNGKS